MTVDSVVGGKATGKNGGTTGRADAGAHVELREQGAFGSESVEVGGVDVGMSVTAEISPAPIVRENEDDVRPWHGILSSGRNAGTGIGWIRS